MSFHTSFTANSISSLAAWLSSAIIEPDGGRHIVGYDSNNRVQALVDPLGNRTILAYDSRGNLTSIKNADGNQATKTEPAGDITTNVWDSQNRLSSIILPAGTIHTFAYAPNNLRVKAEDGSDTTKFLWDGSNVLLETDGSDVTQALYTLKPQQYGNLLSRRDGTTSRFYHFDPLGSTLLLSDGTETPTSQYIYEAYGSILSQPTGVSNRFTFVGRQGYQYEAALDKYYLRARWYGPDIAAFLSRDPLGFDAGFVEKSPGPGSRGGLIQEVFSEVFVLSIPHGVPAKAAWFPMGSETWQPS